jgi:hypothetical protein
VRADRAIEPDRAVDPLLRPFEPRAVGEHGERQPHRREHAVRAPGVKWTLAACRRDVSDGVASVSMQTVPVNQSLGPTTVSSEFLVICMSVSVSRSLLSGEPA